MIFFKRVNSSNISSLNELNPPPALGAAAGAGAILAGGLGGALLGAGAAGGAPPGIGARLANEGIFTPPSGGAAGGLPAVGGNLGAGGSPALFGIPPLLEADGGPELGADGGPLLGADGGPVREGGLPPDGADGGPLAAIAAGAADTSPAPPPESKLNNVPAAFCFALPGVATTFLEEELCV
jgi:hypothetical protein